MATFQRKLTYILGGLIGVLFILITVGILRIEGWQMQETIRPAGKEATAPLGPVATDGIRNAAVGTQEVRGAIRDMSRGVLDDVATIVRKGKTNADETASGKNGSAQGNADPRKPRQENSGPRRALKEAAADETVAQKDDRSSTQTAKPPEPTEVVTDLFRIGGKIAKGVDTAAQEVFKLDSKEEIELGEKLHKSVLKQLVVARLPKQEERIARLARPLLEMRERKEIPYTFTIVKNDDVNAFAMPGGNIYVYTALLKFAKTDAELQFVLGHEIGHIDLKHCVRNYAYAARAADVGGDLAQVGVAAVYHLYELQFNEDLELQSDEYAFRRLLMLGRTPDEALSFHRRFLVYLKGKGIETAERKPTSVPEAIETGIRSHFRSHPPSEERIRRLEQLKLPASDKGRQD